MLRVKDILKEIEQYAPLPLQESFDNAGVQVGDVNQRLPVRFFASTSPKSGGRGDRDGV